MSKPDIYNYGPGRIFPSARHDRDIDVGMSPELLAQIRDGARGDVKEAVRGSMVFSGKNIVKVGMDLNPLARTRKSSRGLGSQDLDIS